jgi:hypothetical protein
VEGSASWSELPEGPNYDVGNGNDNDFDDYIHDRV